MLLIRWWTTTFFTFVIIWIYLLVVIFDITLRVIKLKLFFFRSKFLTHIMLWFFLLFFFFVQGLDIFFIIVFIRNFIDLEEIFSIKVVVMLWKCVKVFSTILIDTCEFICLSFYQLGEVIVINYSFFLVLMLDDFLDSLSNLDDLLGITKLRIVDHSLETIKVVTLHQYWLLVLDHGNAWIIQMD